jgi:hypothetical protein
MQRLFDIIAVALAFGRFRRTGRMSCGFPQWRVVGLALFPRYSFFVTLAVVLLEANGGRAAPITFQLSGVLTQVVQPPPVAPPPLEGFHVGQPFWGRLTYDTGVPDLFPDDSQRGYYLQDPEAGATGLEFYVGHDFFRTDPAQGFALSMGNDIPTGVLLELPGDSFTYNGGSAVSSLQGDVPWLKLGAISAWIDSSSKVFANDSLPTAFDVLAFDRMEIEASIILTPFPFFSQIILTGAVEEIYLVPEPNGSAMFAVVAVFWCVRRRAGMASSLEGRFLRSQHKGGGLCHGLARGGGNRLG